MSTEQQLQELLALPIGLTHVLSMDGQKLYSSGSLKTSILNAMQTDSLGKKIYKSSQKMMMKSSLVPVFTSKNIIQLIRHKWRGRKITGDHGITAFYTPSAKKIIILLDNNILGGFETKGSYIAKTGDEEAKEFDPVGTAMQNLKWGRIEIHEMCKLILHEGMHFIADTKPPVFWSMFKTDLIKYYDIVFKKIFSLKKSPPNLEKLVHHIFFKLEGKPNIDFPKYAKLLETYLAPVSTLKKSELIPLISDFVVCNKLYKREVRLLLGDPQKYRHILVPLYSAYKELYNKVIPTNFCVQEITVPSEVIAIRSELLTDAKSIKAFSLLG